jgi:hypothetical protein
MRKFIVAKPNLHIKQDGKIVKLAVGTEYTCDEESAASRLKSGHLIDVKEAKKVKSQAKQKESK